MAEIRKDVIPNFFTVSTAEPPKGRLQLQSDELLFFNSMPQMPHI